MRIGIASDHAGFEVRKFLVNALKQEGYDIADFGPEVCRSVDYPDYAAKVGTAVQTGRIDRGILICATGQGMNISVNKFPRVRAALCNDIYLAKMAREHNDANVLCLGGRVVAKELAWEITKTFLETPFQGGRHRRRVNKIHRITDEFNRP
ncbi:MAG: ribose 5-phosphate isomerase B [Candidatus Omnitrophica bacterium]|nr:ribose 5-phosphate isomerase B [Candidatus Omnitrophota bacterium]MCM8768062.1 ribose 5-phosphate isomerase B [Candidatus Omnitrophota bacterium]